MIYHIGMCMLHGRIFKRKTRMSGYNFQHVWKLGAPLEIVWGVICEPENWPAILYGSSGAVSLDNENMLVPGNSCLFTIKGRLPYSLSFQIVINEIKHQSFLYIEIKGDLRGYGELEISEKDNLTTILFNMNVFPAKLWMKLVSPLARSYFINNHNFVVNKSYHALKNKISMEMACS